MGKVLDKEHIEKMRLGNILRKPVLVTNKVTGDSMEFSSMTEAGKFLGLSRVSVSKYLVNNLSYKEYIISERSDLSLIDKEITKVSSPSNDTKISQQPVLLTNKETGDIKEFTSMTDAAKYLDTSRARLWYFLSKTVKTGDETLKGYTISSPPQACGGADSRFSK